MQLIYENSRWEMICSFQEKDEVKEAGFRWDAVNKRWFTPVASIAETFKDVANETAIEALEMVDKKIQLSRSAAISEMSIPAPDDKSYFPYQHAGITYACQNESTLIGDEMGLGKGLAHGTPVLTFSGFTSVEELQVGDSVIGRNGHPTKVTGVFPQGVVKRYRVSFNDGTSVVTDGEHRWSVQHVRNAHRKPGEWHVKTTAELMPILRDGAGNATWKIPIVSPVKFEQHKDLPIAPYLLGALLGDGGIKTRIRFSSNDAEMITNISELLPDGVKIKHVQGPDYGIVSAHSGANNPLMDSLRELGLFGKGSHDKFVPRQYLFADQTQRIELLRGLMDTDGHAGADGTNEFCSVSRDLADAVIFLCQSLGGIARQSVKILPDGGSAYRVNIKLSICPFGLKRKEDAWLAPTKYLPSRNIVAIDFEDYGETTCIKVAAEDELFVIDNFIVTHNTIQAIGVINATKPETVLIICPATLKLNWKKELQRWLVDVRNIHVLNAPDQFPTNPDIVIMNYDIANKFADQAKALKWSLVVCDEAHYMKNPKSQRTMAVVGHQKKVSPIRADKKIFLTGTPITNRPIEIWPLVSYLWPSVFSNMFHFAKRYCGASNTGWGWDFSGHSNMEELQNLLRSSGMIRRLKKDVLTELPPKTRQVVVLPSDTVKSMIGKEEKQVKQFEVELKKLKKAVSMAKAQKDEAGYKNAVSNLRQAYNVKAYPQWGN